MKKSLCISLCVILLSVSSFAQKNKIKIETEYGNIILMLYDNTPLNTANMVKQANDHVYDSTLFHRVIPNFMIQGGDPESKNAIAGQMLGNGGLKYTIPAEINETAYHKRGALGVARDGNPQKAGSATQFYIVTGKVCTDAELDMVEKRIGYKYNAAQREAYKKAGGAPHLDGGYTVFGEVLEGMDVVDKISAEARDRNDRPSKDIRMTVTVMKHKRKKFLGIF